MYNYSTKVMSFEYELVEAWAGCPETIDFSTLVCYYKPHMSNYMFEDILTNLSTGRTADPKLGFKVENGEISISKAGFLEPS